MLLNPDLYLQSIVSKHIPCTDSKPNRIKTVTSSGHSTKIASYSIELDYPDAHIKALVDHATELHWLDRSDYAIGSIPDGYVLVLIPKQRD
jgi:hypothetical protein